MGALRLTAAFRHLGTLRTTARASSSAITAAAIPLLRALVAMGLRQLESMANAAIRSVAVQAGLDEFDATQQYARQLVEAEKDFSTMLTPAGWAARGE